MGSYGVQTIAQDGLRYRILGPSCRASGVLNVNKSWVYLHLPSLSQGDGTKASGRNRFTKVECDLRMP